MTQITPTDELSAVNVILTNLGEAPVNTLTGNIPLDAAQALAVLHEVSREVQKRGWYFNTEFHTFSPDSNSEILLPKNTLDVRSDDCDRDIPVVQRGTRLYNMTPRNHGFKFDKSINVKIVLGLSFEELPQTARSYIFLRAARVFQVRQLGDQLNTQDDTSDEKMAYVELQSEQNRMKPYSMKDNVSISSALAQRPTININV